MATFREQFSELSCAQKRTVHLLLCEHALDKWRDYFSSRGGITYTEAVCGSRQVMDGELPADALESARQGCDLDEVGRRYREPIAAIQDEDLGLPESVAYAYYAIFNLFRRYTGHEACDDWLIVNQALSSEDDEEKWEGLFEGARQRAMKETVSGGSPVHQ